MLPWGCSAPRGGPGLSQAGESLLLSTPPAASCGCWGAAAGLSWQDAGDTGCVGLSREGQDEWLSRRAGGRGGDAPEAWLLQGRGFEDKSPCGCAASLLGGCGIELIPRAGGVCLSPRPPRGDSSHGQGQRCTPGCPEASSGAQTHGSSPERAAGSQGVSLRDLCAGRGAPAHGLWQIISEHRHCQCSHTPTVGHHCGRKADRSGLGQSHHGSKAAH